MFKKFRLPALFVLGTALTLLSPNSALARHHERYEHVHHRHRFTVHIGVGPRYYGPYYRGGFYDRWGYWHPYPGYY
jgi:hypothetical protein